MFAFTNFKTFVPVQADAALAGFADDPGELAGWITEDCSQNQPVDRQLPDGRLERPAAFVQALACVNEALDQLRASELALEQQLSDLRGYIASDSRDARTLLPVE